MTPRRDFDVQELGWSPQQDMLGAKLGDQRLTARLQKIIVSLTASPGRSLPEVFTDHAELAAMYRFTQNDGFGWRDIMAPHVARTGERAARAGRVLAIHDTTDVTFTLRDGHLREDLARVTSRTQGFCLHATLVTTGDGSRCPLGIVRLQPFVHRSEIEDDGSVEYWRSEGGLYDNESTRWKQGIVESQKLLGGAAQVIHVADRESDIYDVICYMEQNGLSYVLRVNQDRAVVDEEDPSVRYVSDALKKVPWLTLERKVLISGRSVNRSEKSLKTHPARAAREAVLSFRSARLELKRPSKVPASSGAAASQTTNIVEVLELNPPPGEEPVRWVLMTSEPITTQDEILQVVDDYRGRWPIEELFKGAKSGCALESRQAESAAVLLKMTALTMPIAAHLLLIRYLQRHQPDQPASMVFSDAQIVILRADPAARLTTPEPTVGDAVAALARTGGHRKSNGPPGWLILSRAYTRLLDREFGWNLARLESTKKYTEKCVE